MVSIVFSQTMCTAEVQIYFSSRDLSVPFCASLQVRKASIADYVMLVVIVLIVVISTGAVVLRDTITLKNLN